MSETFPHSSKAAAQGKSMKQAIIGPLLVAARWYLRYAPISTGKPELWESICWRGHEFVARTRFGTRMAGNARDLIQGRIYYFGVWEPNVTAFIVSRLHDQPDRTFVDVGANIGYYSLLAAKFLRAGRVIAVEAFPHIYQKLVRNVKLNGFPKIRDWI